MTIFQLQCFLSVCENLKFSDAAENLFVSQSTVSKKIKQLEEELDCILFNRSTRKVSITAAGIELIPFAKQLVEYSNEFEGEIRMEVRKETQTLTLVAISLMDLYDITDLLTEFNETTDQFHIIFGEQTFDKVATLLDSGRVDFGISYIELIDSSDYKTYPIIEDELCVVVHKNHKLANSGHISLGSLRHEHLMYINRPGNIRFIRNVFKEFGFEPPVPASDVWVDTLLDYAKDGSTVVLLARKILEGYTEPELRILDLIEKPKLTLALIAKKQKQRPGMKEFINYITDRVESL